MNNFNIALIIVGCIIMLISFFPKSSNFISVFIIFKNHLSIFKGNALQFIGIFLTPILFSIAIVSIRCVSEQILNNLNIVLSILLTMLFSIMSILCAFINTKKEKQKYNSLLKQTFNSTLFETIICLVLLFISFTTLFIGNFEESLILKINSGVIYYMTILVILNIFILIKRIQALFDNS